MVLLAAVAGIVLLIWPLLGLLSSCRSGARSREEWTAVLAEWLESIRQRMNSRTASSPSPAFRKWSRALRILEWTSSTSTAFPASST